MADWTLKYRSESFYEVNKSRFFAVAERVDGEEAALEFASRNRQSDATHNAWAYRLGENRYRFADDGEVSGTAGRPIFQALETRDLVQVAVLVSRHYGGVRLGVGGLVRAYGGVAAMALEAAEIREVRSMKVLQVGIPFDELGSVYRVWQQLGVSILEEDYRADGVQFLVQVDSEREQGVHEALGNATQGKALVKSIDMKD